MQILNSLPPPKLLLFTPQQGKKSNDNLARLEMPGFLVLIVVSKFQFRNTLTLQASQTRGVLGRKATEAGERVEAQNRGKIPSERESTCMLLNQIAAETSHRVEPAHAGVMTVFDDLETQTVPALM